MPNFRRRERYTYEQQPYNSYEDVPDNDFTPLINTILSKNESFSILGAAGCGKSYLIKQLQTELKAQNKKIISLAPTNKASLIINGITLHKFVMKMKTAKSIAKLQTFNYIFVDEISMVKEIFYKLLLMLKQKKYDY